MNTTKNFYIMRTIYAFTLAIMLATILLFTFKSVQDKRDYTLAKELQEYNIATGFQYMYE